MKVCPKCGKQYADDANFCPTDAARLVSSQAIPVVTSSDGVLETRFERGERLGGGPSGEVFRAVDRQTGAAVALKLVSPQVLAMPQVAQRAERELKQLERVEHRALANVITSGKQGAQLWLAMELVEGARTVADVVAASGPLDPQRASEIVLSIGEALIEAAKVGVVHRDLAPKNVLVTDDGVKLINLCIPVPGSDKVPGVPEFVAPDPIEGKPIDQRSNIYSLGALYYFLLTGRPPFTGDLAAVHQAHLNGGPVPASQLAPVPGDIDAVLAKAMERNAAKRHLTLRQLLDDIERVARGPEGGTGATAPFGRAGKKGPMAATMLGVAPSPINEAKTRSMDVHIPPEARREIEAMDAPRGQQAMPSTPAPAGSAASPWTPPAGAPPPPSSSPLGTAPVSAGPMVSAGPPPAAVPAKTVTQPPAAGKKRPGEEKRAPAKIKGKFRETMWFKKGELDVAAAEAAAAEQAQGKEADLDRADSLPMEDRYTDDGSLTRGDADRYSLKTGSTSMMPAIRPDQVPPSPGRVSEDELIGEMKRGRTMIIAAVALVVIGLIAVAVAFLI